MGYNQNGLLLALAVFLIRNYKHRQEKALYIPPGYLLKY
jgi:hypothetical protein